MPVITRAMTTVTLALSLLFAGLVATTPPADAARQAQMRAPVGNFRISQAFHGRHAGIDFAAPHGTLVRAVSHGRVVKVRKWRHSYGKHVVIRHARGSSLSAHLSTIRVREGQRVRRGQVIGRVGSTGKSTGPHLHFEFWRGGRAVNPIGYFWR